MTICQLRKRLSERIHAADIAELCLMAQCTEGNGMKAMLFKLAGDKDRRVASNALWVFSHFNASDRSWLQNKQKELIDMALSVIDVTSLRLVLTLLERQTFEAESIRTDFLDFCLCRMVSDAEPVSIRSLSMKLAYKMCLHYPELLEELRMSVDLIDKTSADSAGLKSCRRNVLRLIDVTNR